MISQPELVRWTEIDRKRGASTAGCRINLHLVVSSARVDMCIATSPPLESDSMFMPTFLQKFVDWLTPPSPMLLIPMLPKHHDDISRVMDQSVDE